MSSHIDPYKLSQNMFKLCQIDQNGNCIKLYRNSNCCGDTAVSFEGYCDVNLHDGKACLPDNILSIPLFSGINQIFY